MKKTMQNKKGITLIALIITILIMLILVGVTVSVVLQGGLFETARNASNKTEMAAEKERLIVTAAGAYDSQAEGVSKTKLEEALGADWEVTGEGPFTCTSPNGNVFTVTADGEVNDYKEPPFINKTYYVLGDIENGVVMTIEKDSYKTLQKYMDITNVELVQEDDQNFVKISYTDGDDTDSTQFRYIATNNNVLLFYDETPFYKNNNDIVYDLSGEYVYSQDGDSTQRKYVFTEGTGDTTYYRNYNNSGWSTESGSNTYLSFAGRYFLNGEEIEFTNGYKTFVYDGKTYTNESASTDTPESTAQEITPENTDFVYGTYYDIWYECIEITDEAVYMGAAAKVDISYDETTRVAELKLPDGETGEFRYLNSGTEMILFIDGDSIFATSKNVFDSSNFNLSGEYVNEEGNKKISFTAEEMEVIKYTKSGESWQEDTSGSDLTYLEVDGKYYWNTGEEIVIDSNGKITLNDEIYSPV